MKKLWLLISLAGQTVVAIFLEGCRVFVCLLKWFVVVAVVVDLSCCLVIGLYFLNICISV